MNYNPREIESIYRASLSAVPVPVPVPAGVVSWNHSLRMSMRFVWHSSAKTRFPSCVANQRNLIKESRLMFQWASFICQPWRIHPGGGSLGESREEEEEEEEKDMGRLPTSASHDSQGFSQHLARLLLWSSHMKMPWCPYCGHFKILKDSLGFLRIL